MTNKYVKKCSTSLTIRKMHIKTIMRCHFTAVRMATIKKTERTTANQDTETRKNLVN